MPGYLSISVLFSQSQALLMVACLSIKTLLLLGFIPCLLPYLSWLVALSWPNWDVVYLFVCVRVCVCVCAERK